MPDLVGHTLGQYRIVEQIGLGGMATVYKAYQPALDRYVAIKVLPAYYAHEPGFAERFIREAKAVAKLTHPHVLPIYDFGQENGLSYIVMQYVDAGTLKEMLGQPINLMTATNVIEQIADALDYAHDQGIIHRDVKPSNVLMDRGRWALLSDFGLAKIVEGSVQLTGSGVGVGTPAYMAPEQGQGLKVNRRADIYSLGIILYEMVTGRVPFEAETPMAIVVKHITEPLPLPRKINPDLPESVERIIMKALAKNPDDRYETAGKMARALRKTVASLDTAVVEAMPSPPTVAAGAGETPTVLEEGDATRVVPPPATATPKGKGFPAWAMAAAGVVALLLLVGGLLLARALSTQRAGEATEAAATEAPQAVEVGTPTEAGGETVASPTSRPTEPPPTETPPRPVLGDLFAERALNFIESNPPIFEDDFSNPDSGWALTNDQQGQEGIYEDGAFVVRVPEVVGGENLATVPLPMDKPLSNFVLQFDLVTIDGGAGANWAVGFRVQRDRGLYAGLSVQPRGFGIVRFESGEETRLAQGMASYNPYEETQVTLAAIGPAVMLFLNGERVGVARTEFLRPGRITFNANNSGNPMVAYRFDNVRLWDLTALAEQLQPEVPDITITEDFEDGQAAGWELGEGAKIIQQEDGNHVLRVDPGYAFYLTGEWPAVNLIFRAKPLDTGLMLNFNLREVPGGSAHYMAHFLPEEILLHRFVGDQETEVARAPIVRRPDEWREVNLISNVGHIEIRVDDELVLTYDDPDPLLPGTIVFASGDSPVPQLIDDVVIEPLKP